MDCLGTKKRRWQRSPFPKMLASMEDRVVQGTKTSWWRSPFSWPCGEERTKGRKPWQHLKLCDYRSPSSPKQQSMRNKDKTKRNLDSKTSQMLLIRLLHITRQGLSPGSGSSWNWSVAGIHGGTWPPAQQKMTGRCLRQRGLCALSLQLSAAGGLEWLYGAGAVLFFPLLCHGWNNPGRPGWQQWERKEGKKVWRKSPPWPRDRNKGELLPCAASASR